MRRARADRWRGLKPALDSLHKFRTAGVGDRLTERAQYVLSFGAERHGAVLAGGEVGAEINWRPGPFKRAY